VQLDGFVEQVPQLLFLLVGGQAFARGPVDVRDGGDPGGAEFARGGGEVVGARAGSKTSKPGKGGHPSSAGE
jgi:hypothetical protein